MPSLTTRSGGSLESKPLLHVQSVHDSGVAGGWSDVNAFTIGDINRLILNEIAGASLTCVDGGDSTLVLTTPGTGKTSAPINNPANGTHLDLCHITLPVGTYVLDRTAGYHSAEQGETQWYNKSDTVSEYSILSFSDHINYYRPFVTKFKVVGSSKNFYMRKIYHTTHPKLVSDWGHAYTFNAGGQTIHDDFKIYKIG